MKQVVVSPETKRLSIEMVIRLVLMQMDSDPFARSVLDGLAGSDPETKKEMKLEGVRAKLAGFCYDQKIFPVKKDDAIANCHYEGDVGQDKEFYISVEEFKLFARSCGVDVSNDENDWLFHQSIEEPSFSKSKLFRLSPAIPLPSPSGEEVEEDWGSEVEEAFRAEMERKKARLKIQIPGKLPNTRIGKLAVKIAWEIEVDTGIPAATKAVMDRLCKLAEKVSETDSIDSNEDCLLYANISVLGQEMVRWKTADGTEKRFGQQTCKQALSAWRNSLPQKVVRRR